MSMFDFLWQGKLAIGDLATYPDKDGKRPWTSGYSDTLPTHVKMARVRASWDKDIKAKKEHDKFHKILEDKQQMGKR